MVTHLDSESPRTGYIVSIPVDLTGLDDLKAMEKKGVQGRYASIERLQEVGDKVEWR